MQTSFCNALTHSFTAMSEIFCLNSILKPLCKKQGILFFDQTLMQWKRTYETQFSIKLLIIRRTFCVDNISYNFKLFKKFGHERPNQIKKWRGLNRNPRFCLINRWGRECLRYFAPMKTSYYWWRDANFGPMLDTYGLWSGRDLYRATPAMTQVSVFNQKDRLSLVAFYDKHGVLRTFLPEKCNIDVHVRSSLKIFFSTPTYL